MLLDRDLVSQLIALSALERTLKGPERLLREEEVSRLVKAAYDNATPAAREAFMARVEKLPTSAWPWSAVQAMAPRGGGGGGSGSLGGLVAVPKPAQPPTAPAALVLIRAQAESPDADPGNRIPDRGTPEGAPWEPLHKALDNWDTMTIAKWIGPQGWIPPNTGVMPPRETGNGASPTAGKPADTGPGPAPANQTMPVPAGTPWLTRERGLMIAAGTVAVIAVSGAAMVVASRSGRSRLEEELYRQQAAREAQS